MHMKSVSAETDAETPAARVLCALQHAREGWCFAGRRRVEEEAPIFEMAGIFFEAG